ncbi:hypothetical protein T4E_8355 [Trichinella pseudospiralis]|uniref:Uncharacterized protein n=1 Tax=Trichinella pseudospiralis TaxID=6337 RepID=A0A0V0YN00_TRIPS|nr:hypothetical protein T4E_8355 [Trichinella pseudospiralis]
MHHILSTSSEEEDQLENDELDSDAEAEVLLDPSMQLGEWLNQLQVLSQGKFFFLLAFVNIARNRCAFCSVT